MGSTFDQLIGIIVAGAVLLIYAFIQFKGWQSSSEATMYNMVYSDALELSEIVETDVENMRTEEQTTEAESRGNLVGGTIFECQLTTSGGVTTEFKFPTLSDPDNAYTLSDPDDASVSIVTYELIDTGNTMVLTEGQSTSTIPLYRLDRTINGNYAGGSQGNITHFLVELSQKGSDSFSSNSGPCPTELDNVRFEFKIATNSLGQSPDGQSSTSQVNISRFGTTVILANWE